MVARIAENGRLHAGHAILYLKICVPECPFNEPLHRKCNLFLRHVQVNPAYNYQEPKSLFIQFDSVANII